MKTSHLNNLLLLNLANVLISTSGALGKYIAMPVPAVIWWRCIIALVLLYAYCRYKNISLKLHRKQDWPSFILSALLMGGHWITYFYSLKLSNVALALLSLYTYPIITALLEPLFFKTKIDRWHLVLGGIVLLGIAILAPELHLESQYTQGILLGLLSALCLAIRTLLIKQHVARYNGTMLMWYQLFVLSLVLAPVLVVYETTNIRTQYPYVILLGILTTAIGHTLMVHSLKHFKASTASIISSMLPIYGIIIAYFFLKEIPATNTLLGGFLIMITVVIEGIRSQKRT